MTTMDSDSASQDSDDGRRFRFEATRKDANGSSLVESSRSKRIPTPLSDSQRRRASRRRSYSPPHDRKNENRQRDRDDSRSSTRRDHRGRREESRSRERSRHSRDTERNATVAERRGETMSRGGSPKLHRREISRSHVRKRSREKLPEEKKIRPEKRHRERFYESREQRHSREHSRERHSQYSSSRLTDYYSRSREKSSEDSIALEKVSTRRENDRVGNGSDAASSRNHRCLGNLSNLNGISGIEEDTHGDDSSPKRFCRRSTSPRRSDDSRKCATRRNNDGPIRRQQQQQQQQQRRRGEIEKKSRSDDDDDNISNDSCNGEMTRTPVITSSPASISILKTATSDDASPIEERSRMDILPDDGNIFHENSPRSSIKDVSRANPLESRRNEIASRSRERGATRQNSRPEVTPEIAPRIVIGPALPEIIPENIEDRCEENAFGPALPPKNLGDETTPLPSRDEQDSTKAASTIISVTREILDKSERFVGPTFPEEFHIIDEANEDDDDDDDNIDEKTDDAFGPILPPHLKMSCEADELFGERRKNSSESENEDFMGPLPADHPSLANNAVHQQLELRARRLKAELAAGGNEDENKREEWMTELPPTKSASLGLGPRKFRTREGPDMSDRSSWTDTPADKARKRIERLENKNVPSVKCEREPKCKSIETEKSRKREKSLLEIHQKKMQKKKRKEEKEMKHIGRTVERRRPFDRDIDLQANRFDDARKKSMLLSARKLDDRFSRGKI